jgi:hypothetical protein
MVKLLVDGPVILQADVYVQTAAELARKLLLFGGEGQSDYGSSIVSGRKFGKPAPAAADIQNALTGSQADFPADQVELSVLRRVYVPWINVLKIGASVSRGAAQSFDEQVIAEIIVVFYYLKCPALTLHIEEQGLCRESRHR